MARDISGTAMEAAQAVFDATRSRPFEHAVHVFIGVLRSVPDCAPTEVSAGTLQVVEHLAERVVEAIEARIESDADSKARQLDLSESVYSIRGALEKLDYWQRHYSVG